MGIINQILSIIVSLILSAFAINPIEVQTPYMECGTCGAHVTEWWYVRDMADTEFVAVCHDCYECFKD